MEICGVSILAGKIFKITDKVLSEIEPWSRRTISFFFPIVYLDAMHFKVRQDGRYKYSGFYIICYVDGEGNRYLFGFCLISGSEGAIK